MIRTSRIFTLVFQASVLCLFLGELSSCSGISIVPLEQNGITPTQYPATPVDEVGIFRSSKPFASFKEIDLITVSGEKVDVKDIYRRMRAAAAGKGAQAVIDVKINASEHSEPRTTTSCNANGACSTSTYWVTVSNYTASGTMIRRNE